MGVDPAEVAAWRQSQIAEAQPATEAFDQVRVDRIIGMNVRSPDDQDFGDIGDVLLNPQTGAVEYVTVTRGGFFGIGEDEVIVPWERLYVTADFASFVLPVDDATLDAAPTGATEREQIDTFWQDNAPERAETSD
jgi:sporulation protein YlmC with PRC-barrel domain